MYYDTWGTQKYPPPHISPSSPTYQFIRQTNHFCMHALLSLWIVLCSNQEGARRALHWPPAGRPQRNLEYWSQHTCINPKTACIRWQEPSTDSDDITSSSSSWWHHASSRALYVITTIIKTKHSSGLAVACSPLSLQTVGGQWTQIWHHLLHDHHHLSPAFQVIT